MDAVHRSRIAAESAKQSAYNAQSAVQTIRQENLILKNDVSRLTYRVAQLELQVAQLVSMLSRRE